MTGGSELWDFVQPNSWEFFNIPKVSAEWLIRKVVEWKESEDYRMAQQFVTSVKVVNDAAERGIKLASDYAKSLTKNRDKTENLPNC